MLGVTHFVWMIAWEWEIHMGMADPNSFSAHMPQEGPSFLSLQVLEDKQSLRGKDCNVPKISMKLIGTLLLFI